MKSEVITGAELHEIKLRFKDDFSSLVKSLSSSSVFITDSRSLIPVGWSEFLRAFMDEFKEKDNAIKNVVLASLYEINRTSPHSIELYIRSMLSGCPRFENIRPTRVSSKVVIGDILENTTDQFLQPRINFLIEGLRKAGSSGQVKINVSSAFLNDHVLVNNGYVPNCRLHDFFSDTYTDVDLSKCKVLIVDGKINDVGEIHHVLQRSFDTKEQFVTITTGLSEDVANTLQVNWQQGKTNVLPFVVDDDIGNINEIKDIATVCGIIPCSIKSGARLSNTNLDELPVMKAQYSSSKNRLVIYPGAGAALRINRLRSQIKKKISLSKENDVIELLNSRLSRLSSRSLEVNMSEESRYSGFINDKLNSFFSHFSSCGTQGVIDCRENIFSDYHLRYLPFFDALNAVRRAASDRNAIDNIRAVVRLEHDR